MTKKLVKGQDVYIVPFDSRDKPFHAKVIGLGSKYITVNWLHYTENKFYVSDWKHVNGRYTLYLSEEHYKETIAANEKRKEIYNYCLHNLSKLDYGQLCAVEVLIKEACKKK